ncbi:glucuronate isomerase [Algoriphagus sediminis]|uniref:Uronate isomerase n=1 Tax=Algoriphagus sediminis TaxID=3057113 RepID=A0ABT7YB43_9BACT|nr:glucuronate isomerase [Algoriphagus sediminis]MDN3203737.1 glucuronate isomerase [Algoriphagus sediminis]
MINPIVQPDFLLSNSFAEKLYFGYAADLPIIDYHNHLPPAEINENRQFENISQIWLAGDHYKWRAMRTLGIPEKYITGSASDSEKFSKWAETVPYTVRNPLYHWTHMELSQYFDIERLLSPENSKIVYKECNSKLKSSDFSVLGLLAKKKVETVCTTDDPIDSLDHHLQFSRKGHDLGLFPAFRPDKAYAAENPITFIKYLENLSSTSGIEISSYADLLAALKARIEHFHKRGCRVADHGLENLRFFNWGSYNPESLFHTLQEGKRLQPDEVAYFKFHTLVELAKLYHQKGWVMQFHLGALRNTNSRAFSTLGPDTGFDSIGDFDQASGLAKFLNQMDSTDQLCKTIIYNLNPRDNEVFASMIGNFNDGSVKGKIQFGSGWWYLDQKDGMEKQLNALSNMGLVSCFIGMLTDSRSFLSFPRHDYFRRILCNLFGQDVDAGMLPKDEKWLGKIISDICYFNAKSYFDFDSKNIQ